MNTIPPVPPIRDNPQPVPVPIPPDPSPTPTPDPNHVTSEHVWAKVLTTVLVYAAMAIAAFFDYVAQGKVSVPGWLVVLVAVAGTPISLALDAIIHMLRGSEPATGVKHYAQVMVGKTR